jgi:hypothetical protein
MQREGHRKANVKAIPYLVCWLLVLVSLGNATPVTILQPDGGTFFEGDTMTIKWVYPVHAFVVFHLSVDDGISFRYSMFEDKTQMTTDTQVVKWPIPFDPTFVHTGVIIEIRDYDQYLNRGISNPFTIEAKTSIRHAVTLKAKPVVNPAHEIYSLRGVALKRTVSGCVPLGVYVTRSKSGAARLSHGVIMN